MILYDAFRFRPREEPEPLGRVAADNPRHAIREIERRKPELAGDPGLFVILAGEGEAQANPNGKETAP